MSHSNPETARRTVPVLLDKTAVIVVDGVPTRKLSVPGLLVPVKRKERFSIEETNKLFQCIRRLEMEKRRRTLPGEATLPPVRPAPPRE